MRIHRLRPGTEFQFPWQRVVGRDTRELTERDALTAQLQAALAREKVLLRERLDLSQRQAMLAQEFEHRLINGLQLVVSLLSLQAGRLRRLKRLLN